MPQREVFFPVKKKKFSTTLIHIYDMIFSHLCSCVYLNWFFTLLQFNESVNYMWELTAKVKVKEIDFVNTIIWIALASWLRSITRRGILLLYALVNFVRHNFSTLSIWWKKHWLLFMVSAKPSEWETHIIQKPELRDKTKRNWGLERLETLHKKNYNWTSFTLDLH